MFKNLSLGFRFIATMRVTIRNIDRHRAIREGVNSAPVAVIADGFGNCDIDAERENSRVGTGLAFCVDCECGAGHLSVLQFCKNEPQYAQNEAQQLVCGGPHNPRKQTRYNAHENNNVFHLNTPPIVVTGIAYRPAVVSNADDELSDFDSVDHAATSCSKVMDTLRLSASIKRLSRLHRGIEPDVFQLETVLGVRSKAAATADVPPSVSIMSVAVCMVTPYGIRKLAASANYE